MFLRGTNFHTWLFTLLVKAAFDKADREKRSIEDLIKIWPPRGLELEHAPALGVDVGIDDYEEAGLTSGARKLISFLNWAARRSDPNVRWTSADEARSVLRDTFGKRLVSHVRWTAPSSDATLLRLVTQGLGAHMLRRRAPGTYEVDLWFLSELRVRAGFVKAGSVLTLRGESADTLAIESIRWARGEHRPGDTEWELAKLAFRVSVAIAGTVRDHAVKCHFVSANSAVIATRRGLPAEHDVRRFLRAFQYRTPAINAGALVTLIPENAIFHRLFPFEWEGLQRLYEHSKADYRFRTLPDELREHGTHPETFGAMPYAMDALDIWNLLHTLTTDYLDAIGVSARPADDQDLAKFHRMLKERMPPTAELPAIETRAELANLLSRLLYDATGFHEQVGGGIGDYLDDLAFVVPAMVDGKTLEECLPSRNTMIQGTMLGVLTNFAMPGLRSDFSALVREPGRPAIQRFREGLAAHSDEVKRRNTQRALPHLSYYPDGMEISVSI